MSTFFKRVVELDKKEYELLVRIMRDFFPSELEDDFTSEKEKEKLRNLHTKLALKLIGNKHYTV